MSTTRSGLRREAGISLDKSQWKRASACVEGRISWFFFNCGGVPLELQRGPQLPARDASGRSSLHTSREGPLGIHLRSLPGLRSSSGVEIGTSGFLSRADMDLGVTQGHPQASQGFVSCGAIKFALLSSRKSSVGHPVWFPIGIGGFLSMGHRAVTPAIMF